MARTPMVLLTTVQDAFHGRVVAARLGADGIVSELRGAVGATYPLGGVVELWVEAGAAGDAAELLLADEAAAMLEEAELAVDPRRGHAPGTSARPGALWSALRRRAPWAMVAAALAGAALASWAGLGGI
ncbi:MAG: hypothetical protein ACRDYD_05620 [Acidimicrobiales bacterium]